MDNATYQQAERNRKARTLYFEKLEALKYQLPEDNRGGKTYIRIHHESPSGKTDAIEWQCHKNAHNADGYLFHYTHGKKMLEGIIDDLVDRIAELDAEFEKL